MKTKNNVKTIARTISFVLLVALTASLLFACGDKDGDTKNTDTAAPATEAASGGLLGGSLGTAASDKSAAAMENFLAKLEEGNYVVDGGDYFKATVYSDDLVYYESEIRFNDNEIYDGFALMTVNGNETFFGLLGKEAVGPVVFASEGSAFDAARDGKAVPEFNSLLPNYLIDVSQGNIWNLFYNDPEDPLKFVSYEEAVKSLVMVYADIGKMVESRMQEVYLILDDEDPTEAHLKMSFAEGYPPLDDVDIVITFGSAEADPRAEAWMNDSGRVYPEARTGWDEEIMDLNAVFLPGYGEIAFPFPDFATYAFTVDASAVITDDELRVRDCRATEDDLASYADKLEKAGFKTVEEDGKTYYRLLLREEYKCWSSLYLEYDNGVTITARTYYDFPTYEGLDEINSRLDACGFPQLSQSEALSGFSGVDRAYENEEAWLYFFDFETVLFVNANFDDKDAAEEYVNSYIASLEGYEASQSADEMIEYDEYDELEAYLGEGSEELERFAALEDEGVFYKRQFPEGRRSFKYVFGDDDETVSLMFKYEKFVTADEFESAIAENGFPVCDLSAYDLCRDRVLFQKTMYGQDYDLDYTLSLSFDNAADADKFLDAYIREVRDEKGFDITKPDVAAMDYLIVYTKEAGDKLLVIGCDYAEGRSIVNFEYRIMEKE